MILPNHFSPLKKIILHFKLTHLSLQNCLHDVYLIINFWLCFDDFDYLKCITYLKFILTVHHDLQTIIKATETPRQWP